MIADLEELTTSVRSPDSRTNIGEAVKSYGAGAYRSALVSAWIAVVADIINKIEELEAYGDAQAVQFMSSLRANIKTNNIRKLSDIEDGILETAAHDFELIGDAQYRNLKRLKDDRNYCAHPSFAETGKLFKPSVEQVRAHIVHAITDLMQFGPVRGQSSIEAIVNDIQSQTFPSSVDAAAVFLGKKYLQHARPSLWENMFRLLIKVSTRKMPDWVGHQGAARRALRSLGDLDRARYETWMKDNLNTFIDTIKAEEFSKIIGFLCFMPECWRWLSDYQKEQIKQVFATKPIPYNYHEKKPDDVGVLDALMYIASEYLQAEALKKLGVSRLPQLFKLIDVDELQEPLLKILESVSLTDKEAIIQDCIHPLLVDAAITLFSSSSSYRAAEDSGKAVLEPFAPFMSKNHVALICDGCLENGQIYAAGGICDNLVGWLNALIKIHGVGVLSWVDWDEFAENLELKYPNYEDFLCLIDEQARAAAES
jgi:hypothetical protein